MTRRSARWSPLFVALGTSVGPAMLWGGGCGSGTESDDGDRSNVPSDSRESGCQAWRTASCGYLADCVKGATGCGMQLQAVQCRSDAAAELCASQIASASCGALPAACQLDAVADTSGAIAGCRSYLQAVCSSAIGCNFASSADTCMASGRVDCTRAVGLTESLPKCLEELKTLSCTQWVPRDSCAAVVVLR